MATVFSTCRRCSHQFAVTALGQHTCAGCEPVPDAIERGLMELSGMVDAVMRGQAVDEQAMDALAGQLTAWEDAGPQLERAALTYAAWGWPVFPLRSINDPCDGSRICTESGVCKCPKKPATRNGFKDATTDFGKIRSWWAANPTLNIGLPTGVCFDAIDVDPLSGGQESWAEFRQQKSLPDIHGRVLTASEGFHLYVEVTGYGNRAGIMPGIDYRGRGGYVVAPPSQLHSSRGWRWSVYPSPSIVPSRGGVVPQ